MSPAQFDLFAQLHAERARFHAFLVARLANAADADDLLQRAYLKVRRALAEGSPPANPSAWFFRVLRRLLIDHYRSDAARQRRDDVLRDDPAAGLVSASMREERTLCSCLSAALDALPPRTATLLRRAELGSEHVHAVADSLGLTANHASVLLLRARRALRAALEESCGDCASTACLDCDCVPDAV
jgi:RNA polymerase sigma-70 factor (ECF subfamily)